MATLFPPSGLHPPKSGDGRGGVHPPEVGGGGGRDGGDGFPDYERRLKRARLGLICGMVAISMLFVTVTAVFFLRQESEVIDPQAHGYVRKWVPVELPIRILLINTLILACSSLTLELARRDVAQEMLFAPLRPIVGDTEERRIRIPWIGITVILGCAFIAGQLLAWEVFRGNGFRVWTAGTSPFFYLLTGAHAVHLAVGILILLYAAGITLFHGSIAHKRIVVEVTRWYWHFMGVLWLYVFALLVFAA